MHIGRQTGHIVHDIVLGKIILTSVVMSYDNVISVVAISQIL